MTARARRTAGAVLRAACAMLRAVTSRCHRAPGVAVVLVVCLAGTSAWPQTMDRSAGSMTMRPSGPGGMWTAVERDGLGAGRGERLFRAGRLPGDRTAEAERAGNPVGPDQVACANCHGRSGQGIREGGQGAPAIHGAALLQPRQDGNARPAYDDATLARAIGSGVDAAGQPLGVLMPRYHLADDDMGALVAYLHSLHGAAARGVDDHEVRLATVIAGDVPPERRQAMVQTLRDYAADLAERGGEGRRAWRIETWTLTGAPVERRAQLDELQARGPVAAILGGLGDDSWLAVHQFCEQHAVPCLFPETGLPPADQAAFYSVYLDKGRVLSGQLLARHLKDHPALLAGGPMVQVLPAGWEGYAPASALRGYLGRAAARQVRDVTVAVGQRLDVDFWRGVLARDHPAALALWVPGAELAPLAAALDGRSSPVVFRPLEDLAVLADGKGWQLDVQGLDVRVLSHLQPPATGAVQADWAAFRARHLLPAGQLNLCADAWFAARVLDDALADQPGPGLDVDRMMTRIEYAAGTVVGHPLRPDLALGMGQRFAGKTGWLLEPGGEDGILRVSGLPISP